MKNEKDYTLKEGKVFDGLTVTLIGRIPKDIQT